MLLEQRLSFLPRSCRATDPAMRRRAVGPVKYTNGTIENGAIANGYHHSRSKTPQQQPVSVPKLLAILIFFLGVFTVAWQRLYWVPQALGVDAPPHLFSEARALQTTTHLARTIGNRQVTRPGVVEAAEYLLGEAQKIAASAAARDDIKVEADLERITGAANMVYLNRNFTNAYSHIDNIILAITPKAVAERKAVLVNAHFDSPLGSVGASDCASCAGIVLELARAVVADASLQLPAPVFFLLNGAEETFMQASNGFVNQSKWADRVGAFINVESTGGAGPDVVFQHTDQWVMQAFAKSAVYPRGNSVGQDFFNLEIIPADTDYRSFAAETARGRWPGLDMALLLDAAAYHTDRDVVERIRPGTLQAFGDNVLAAIPALGAALQKHDAQAPPNQAAVYLDLLAFGLVSYSHAVARVLHAVPIVAVLVATVAKGAPVGAVLRGVAAGLTGLLGAIVAPAMLGAGRVTTLGNPMAWYGRHGVAAAIYIPMSLAALLYPCHFWLDTADLTPLLLGWGLMYGVLGWAMTALAGLGSGAIMAMWSSAAVLAVLLSWKAGKVWTFAAPLAAAAPVAVLTCLGSLMYVMHLLEKLTLSGGHAGPTLADTAAGVVLGLGTVATCGYLPLLLAHAAGPRLQKGIRTLLLVSMLAAMAASWLVPPYTQAAPKKVFLQHLNFLAPADDAHAPRLQRSAWSFASFDSVPMEKALPKGLSLKRVPSAPNEYMIAHPVSQLLQVASFEAPPPEAQYLAHLPNLTLTSRNLLPAPNSGAAPSEEAAERLHFRLALPRPGFGVIAVTGPLRAWSFSDALPVHILPDGGEQHIVRFAGNPGSENWDFWLDSGAPEQLQLEHWVAYENDTPQLQAMTDAMPKWTAVAEMMTFVSSWSL